MTNTDIIISEAVANGLYTMEQIENILAGGHMIPLHTFQAWKSFGYTVKKRRTRPDYYKALEIHEQGKEK